MKKLTLVGLVCLCVIGGPFPLAGNPASAASSPGAAGSVEAECISYVDGAPVPADVKPVVILKGSDYEMGYQFFQQLVQIYGREVASRQYLPFNFDSAPVAHKGEWTQEHLNALKAFQWHIKQDAPEFLDFMKGMAEGATAAGVPLSYRDILAHMARQMHIAPFVPAYPATEPAGSENEMLSEKDHCSGFAVWGSASKDGKLLASASGDHFRMFDVTIVAFPNTGNNYIYMPYRVSLLGAGGLPGMNNKGLAYVHHGGGSPWWTASTCPENKWGYGTPPGFIQLHGLRFTKNVDEVKNMLLGSKPKDGVYDQMGFWADIAGNAFIMRCKNLFRKAGDFGETDFLHATNNALLKQLCRDNEGYYEHGGCGTRNPEEPGSSVSRNLSLWDMLHNYHGQVDLEFTKMMWRKHSENPKNPTMAGPHISFVGIMIPKDGNEGLYYVATRCPSKTCGIDGGNNGPVHSFYQLKLAASPAEVVIAARTQATRDLNSADLKLRKLTRSDPAYALLDKMLSQAISELYRGYYYQSLASRSKGNEAVYNYARATRAFTKSQAYANEVYESLVPPPKGPEDLGLKPIEIREIWKKK
jgi:hypothetical protein